MPFPLVSSLSLSLLNTSRRKKRKIDTTKSWKPAKIPKFTPNFGFGQAQPPNHFLVKQRPLFDVVGLLTCWAIKLIQCRRKFHWIECNTECRIWSTRFKMHSLDTWLGGSLRDNEDCMQGSIDRVTSPHTQQHFASWMIASPIEVLCRRFLQTRESWHR